MRVSISSCCCFLNCPPRVCFLLLPPLPPRGGVEAAAGAGSEGRSFNMNELLLALMTLYINVARWVGRGYM